MCLPGLTCSPCEMSEPYVAVLVGCSAYRKDNPLWQSSNSLPDEWVHFPTSDIRCELLQKPIVVTEPISIGAPLDKSKFLDLH